MLVGAASNGITNLSVGTTGNVLIGSTGADPAFGALGVNSGLTNHGVLLGQNNAAIAATAAGTAGQVLTSNGASADPTFQSFGQQLVLLSNQPANNVGSIVFTQMSAKYIHYVLVIRNLIAQNNGTNLTMAFSTDGGGTYLTTGYMYTLGFGQSASAQNNNRSEVDTTILVAGVVSNLSTRAYNAKFDFFNLGNSGLPASCYWLSQQYDSGAHSTGYTGSAHNTGTTAVTAVQFLMSAGNITSGNFYFYGVVEP